MNSMTRPRSASIDCRRPALASEDEEGDKLFALLILNYQYHINSMFTRTCLQLLPSGKQPMGP
ncbi:hypothetical protein, partial [Comamonas sp.]|uniref:hypothetical protein n=1 Tax=Comamonas sp. TaxID=34028 RepID=UPI0026496D7C